MNILNGWRNAWLNISSLAKFSKNSLDSPSQNLLSKNFGKVLVKTHSTNSFKRAVKREYANTKEPSLNCHNLIVLNTIHLSMNVIEWQK